MIITLLTLTSLFYLCAFSQATRYKVMKRSETVTGKPEWKVRTKGYEDYIFYFGKNPGMQNTFVDTERALRDYIGVKLGTNVLASMIKKHLTNQ